jgi:hypothetical protein
VEIDGRAGAMNRGRKGDVGGRASGKGEGAKRDAEWVFAGVEEGNELMGVHERADVEREITPEELNEERNGGFWDGEAESSGEAIEGRVSEIKGRLVNREPEESKEGELGRGKTEFGEVEPWCVSSLEHEEVKSLADDRAPGTQVFG